MTTQTLDLKRYDLLHLNEFELQSFNGGHWLKHLWKAFQALEIADGINESINGAKDGFINGYYQGTRGHGASGSW